MVRSVPRMKTDAEVEAFLDQDLSGLDFAQFKPVRFELAGKDARVNIQVLTYAPFYILGEVKKPGEFPYKPGMSVADAVALAGGYTYRADESKVLVRHSDAAAEVMHRLDANPPVSPGDNIRIPERFL